MELAPMEDKRTDKQARLLLREKLRRTQHKMADVIEGVVDTLAPEAKPAPSRAAERPQIADLLGTSRFCARRACRRAQACLGEPTQCLRVLMPVLDGGRLAGLLARRQRRRRGARTAERG
jgi:hypothetical protein